MIRQTPVTGQQEAHQLLQMQVELAHLPITPLVAGIMFT
jgi:hypothetical protein